MVGASIAALSLLFSITDVPRDTTASRSALAALPGIKMPHLSMPKLRFPRLTRRRGTSDAVLQTERRLKALVVDQEHWYAGHARYGVNPNSVAQASTRADTRLEKVQVQVLYAGKKGWTAIASHPDAPGKNCVIYVGDRASLPMVPRTRAGAVDASVQGEPACDR